MANLFGNIGDDPRMQRQAFLSRIAAARTNLLLMIVFSAVNILMLTLNSGMYFLFSASVPYLLVDFGMFFCGMYPADYYTGELSGMEFADKSLFVIVLILSILILGVYLLCWIFSKKGGVKPLSAALVLFSIDTAIMFLTTGLTSLVDLGFHIWVIVILAMGISAHKKLAAMPKEEAVIESDFTELPTEDVEAQPENNEAASGELTEAEKESAISEEKA